LLNKFFIRKIKLENENYYHVFNRGVDKRDIFLCKEDFERFLSCLKEFNRVEIIGSLKDLSINRSHSVASQPPSGLVEIIAFCLNSNHYHLILKQLIEGGISKFMHKVSMGFAHYFNQKNKRSGALFQGAFEAYPINNEQKLAWLSAYVNCNYEIHKIGKAKDWSWSSYGDYMRIKPEMLCKKEVILSQFESSEQYLDFCGKVIIEAKDIKIVQKYLLNQ